MELHLIDYIIMVIYILITLFVGMRFKKGISTDTFLIAERNLNLFSSSMTIFASKVGAGLLLTYSSLVFSYGFSALWLFAGYVFGYIAFYFFATKLKIESDENKYYTLSDYFRKKYGNTSAYLISVLVFLSIFGWILTNLIGGGKVIALISGFSFSISVILMVIVVMIYLVIGGFASVVKTDVLQGISIIVFFSIILFIIFRSSPFIFTTSKIASIKISEIITFFLTGFLFPLGSAELWQRVYATRNINDIKKSLIITSISYFLLGFIMSLICLRISSLSIDFKSEVALIKGMNILLPIGFAGISIIAFFSAIMSSADTFIFTSSSVFCQDYLQKTFRLTDYSTI